MKTIFEIISDWPVIVQGALGSALFALISYFGPKLTKIIFNKFSRLNSNFRKESLYREYFHKKISRQPGRQDSVVILSIYQSISYIIGGLIFLAIGQLFHGIIIFSSEIGIIGFIFYAFRASNWVDRFTVEKDDDLKLWKRIEEIEIELHKKPSDETVKKIAELTKNNT